ncbi:transient receptor potential cation channel subfamily A member 1 isoform X2 [Drosophila miranda]|uniref:Transient receptor potential cation channel subfamily A member 1 n=1 Tax=Drosophila pseudoobscura pseudoobscura TaxID=46245 RepID=A0A6I8WE10_DROPS|nr:transient receptor potential cation channel subfamily A member 1 isoform X1 [Drosophila persimilis]XP_033241467.1 transient receptor potential cation channel subfamily A member 1 isoform X3 [Drosophila pseudoobscura]XP_033242853.1 transient receptor potential cation channel subfamily A member 1 isoform X2 [Drosophila miranda]
MPKLWNGGVYNSQCPALSSPDLMEAQPTLLPKTRSNSSTSTSTKNRNSKYWIFSMIIERSSGVKRGEIDGDDADTPLEAILPAEPAAEQVCLLRDSPFRILRAAESGNLDDFKRLFMADNTRISLKDGKGRTAAHQATARNRVNILRYIRDQNGDFNAKDNAGNTPLHIAVECDAYEALDYLLSIPVDTGVLNEKKQAPVHLATELNKVKSLRVMGQYRNVIDIQQGGEHGRTALHLAAIYDHEECARILITEFDACPRKPCNNGYYPIHEAAKNASSKTMEVFFQWGEQRGCTREEMISFYDSEGNVPLHSAVHGGDIKAVELCLKSGAKISTQQHDLSTPVHLACAQGAIDIVKLMFEMQPMEKRICLSCTDVQKMTPLHCASMFDHPDIVSYLVSEGADINALDKEHRSPLLLAASRSGWKTVHLLIRLGAGISVKDAAARNVLHFVIMNGGRLTDFAEQVANCQTNNQLQLLLNEKDSMGCSPLHYASRDGHIRSLENLIRLGACINLKNNNNESPLHFAARYGRYNTVRQLLDSEKGSFIINESDGAGMTPLHISSQQGHTRVVQLLLNRGALLHRDHTGRNPLQLAAMSGYTETIELLHSVHSHLLDQVDKDGNTALHLATMENKPHAISVLMSMQCKLVYNVLDMSAIDYAIYYKYPEAALAMVTHEERANEVMALRSDKHPCVTLALIASMPKVFEAVQDKCISKANCKKDSKSFYIKYSFWPYQKTPEQIEAKRKEFNDPKWRPMPLAVVNTMVTHGRVELLAHPLSQKYLQMKWNSYGKYFHLANLLIYSIFLVFVTIYSSLMMNNIELEPGVNKSMSQYCNLGWDQLTHNLSQNHFAATNFRQDSCVERINRTTAILFCAGVIVVYILLNSMREMLQIYQQRLHYILETVNLISWVLYISALVMIVPAFRADGIITSIHYSAASIAVFLSWFRLLLFLQRFDQVGIYVVMFLEILQTLIKVLMVFSILIIAFGLAFYILLSKIIDPQPNHLSFSNIPMSLLRTFSMMLGELDVVGTYVNTYYRDRLKVPMTSFLILSVFMILMPILLMNLLIGLAVGDIESVRRNAQLKRLAMQVVLHTELERKLPHVWLQRVDKMELIEYPNEAKCKVGFCDFILRKWFSNPFTEDSAMDAISFDNNDDFINAELERQRRKLRDISRMLEQQHQLMRLIVQKMEIKTEADDVDEGISPNEIRSVVGSASAGTNRWNSPRIRNKLRAALSFNKSM